MFLPTMEHCVVSPYIFMCMCAHMNVHLHTHTRFINYMNAIIVKRSSGHSNLEQIQIPDPQALQTKVQYKGISVR